MTGAPHGASSEAHASLRGGGASWDYVNSSGTEGNREESGMARKKGDNAVSTWFLRGSTVCGGMLCRLIAPG